MDKLTEQLVHAMHEFDPRILAAAEQAARVNAMSNLIRAIEALILAAVIIVVVIILCLRLRKLAKAGEFPNDHDFFMPIFWAVGAVGSILVLMALSYCLSVLSDPWLYVGLHHPDVAIAGQALGFR